MKTNIPNKVILSLGSNLDDSITILKNAINELKKIITIDKISALAITEPIAKTKQNNYYNIVLSANTKYEPYELLKRIHKIEKLFGRKRETNERNLPRTLDIDIIQYNKLVIESDELTLPHPRAHQRNFVIELWKLIEPNATLVGVGKISNINGEGKIYKLINNWL
jgi:2-amino-4-hydroxy-6-hydroxymethyldihydropteridine diphosphokinase